METRELCSIPGRGRDSPIFYSIQTGTGSYGPLPVSAGNSFVKVNGRGILPLTFMS